MSPRLKFVVSRVYSYALNSQVGPSINRGLGNYRAHFMSWSVNLRLFTINLLPRPQAQGEARLDAKSLSAVISRPNFFNNV